MIDYGRWGWFGLLLALLVSIFGCHPRTEVGAIGYKNVGFEKQLEMDVVGPEGGLPLELDVNGDGKPELVRLYRFKVQNDASKAYEYNVRALEIGAALLKELIQTAVSVYSARNPAPAPSVPGVPGAPVVAPASGRMDLVASIVNDPVLFAQLVPDPAHREALRRLLGLGPASP